MLKAYFAEYADHYHNFTYIKSILRKWLGKDELFLYFYNL